MTTPSLVPLTEDPDYRQFCEERLKDPYPFYGRLRSEDPVHWCEPMKLWLVTRFDDVYAGLRDTRLSSDRTGMYLQAMPEDLKTRVAPLIDHVSKWIQLTDEPAHGRLRKLVNPAFSPKTINALRPNVEKLTAKFLEGVTPGEPFDLVHKFCLPLPATVICEMLGIPADKREAFQSASERVARFSTRGGPRIREHAEPAFQALGELITLFQDLIDERRVSPKGDLLSVLVQAEDEGDRLSNEELYAMCVFIFLAGHETTANGIASGVLALLQNPGQFEAFKTDVDGLVDGLVEETLRYQSPVPRAVRQAREDMLIGETNIPGGAMVMLALGAANRDPARFPDPDRFDMRRQPNRHLAFGFGFHFCLGALLARIEMAIAFRFIATHLPGLRLVDPNLTWRPVLGVRALEKLIVAT